MKKIIPLLGMLVLPCLLLSQNDSQKFSGISRSYQVSGFLQVYKYIPGQGPSEDSQIIYDQYTFRIVGEGKLPDGKTSIYIITLPTITKAPPIDIQEMAGFDSALNLSFVSEQDNGQFFWIEKEVVDTRLTAGYIQKINSTKPWRFAYGPELAVPFKARWARGDNNLRIDPSLVVGGYFGGSTYISKRNPHQLFLIVTTGLTTVSINEYTVSQTNGMVTSTPDGLAMGFQASLGLILQLDNFQIGFIHGWDWAGGEIASDWIYKGAGWTAFSIGYSFMNLQQSEE